MTDEFTVAALNKDGSITIIPVDNNGAVCKNCLTFIFDTIPDDEEMIEDLIDGMKWEITLLPYKTILCNSTNPECEGNYAEYELKLHINRMEITLSQLFQSFTLM